MSRLLLGGAALFGAARAIDYAGPEATAIAALVAVVDFPKPTLAPVYRGMRDLKRQASSETTFLLAPDNTCGFVSGRPGAAFTCNSATETCVFITSSVGFPGRVGCCDDNDCGFRLACLDLSAVSSASLCDNGCKVDSFTAKCTDTTAPFCNTITFSGGTTDYFCNSLSISTAQEASTTYEGQTGRSLTPIAISDTSSGIAGELTNTPTRPNPTTPPAPTQPSPTGPGNNNNTGDGGGGGGSSTNAGAIAGGVVGGVAVIGLAALGIIFLMRRNKKNPPPPPIQPTPQMGQQPGFAPGPNGHQSFYGQPDPTKPGGYPLTQPTPPLQNQPYGAPPPQGGYFPPPVGLAPGQLPDRSDATSPLSNYNRVSQLVTSPSTGSGPGFPGSSPGQQFGTSPGPAGGSPPAQFGATPPPPGQQVHEAGGTDVGQTPYAQGHHRGEMHELG